MRPTKLCMLPFVAAVVGCAAPSMPKEEWQTRIQNQRDNIATEVACCESVSDVSFQNIDLSSEFEFDLTAETAPLLETETGLVPHLGLDIRLLPSDKIIEIFSYSDRRRSMLRLNKILFLRPNIMFLDKERQLINEIRDPNMCYGGKRGSGGLWTRIAMSDNSAYLIIYPSIENPYQPIDTRSVSVSPESVSGVLGGAIIRSVSDSRKTYHTDAAIGLEGLIGIQAIDIGDQPLGRCRETEMPDNS